MNKKLELVLRTLVYNTVVPGGHWSSSAKNYQDFLTARGIHLPIKLFHEYKYPNNVTPQKFEEQVQTLFFFYTFDVGRIKNPRAYAEWMISELDRTCRKNKNIVPLTEEEKLNLINKMCDPVKNLSDAEKDQLADYIQQQRSTVATQVTDLMSQTVNLNPELLDINCTGKNLQDFFEVLDGVSYGYAPMDIKYYIENKHDRVRIEKEQRDKEFVNLIGDYPRVLIHPDRIKIMLDEIKKQKKLQHNIERD